ncbi:MAG: hypothetical protein E7399_06450 [Ruminococcaceae bacterium]|nr:hypothetical protein [Oscillospiraceae bacterium]
MKTKLAAIIMCLIFIMMSFGTAMAETESVVTTPDVSPVVEETGILETEPGESLSTEPSESPTIEPSESPTIEPSESPSVAPSESPSVEPSESPVVTPTVSPTQNPPAAFVLTFSLNSDGESFTATIPAIENGLYSFDGVNYSENNKKTDCKPNTMYTGFVKYAKTADAEESSVVTNTQTTPKVVVKTPEIIPEQESFTSSMSISIYCDTPGATIYYTTNGTMPTVASKKYTGPFTITATSTIKAIAVKENMVQSEAAHARFVRGKIYKRPATYIVTFESNGGSKVDDQRVKRNTAPRRPLSPEKEGYTFAGWYKDSGLTVPYDFKETFLKNITLYAKWEEGEKKPQVQQGTKTIVMYIGKKEAIVFGELKTNDVAPVIVNDRAMLPARFVAENLGATVTWDEKNETVTVKKDNVVILIRVGEHYAEVNGEPVKLDSPAFIKHNRTYTPLRFVSENLGATVEWEEEKEKIMIAK